MDGNDFELCPIVGPGISGAQMLDSVTPKRQLLSHMTWEQTMVRLNDSLILCRLRTTSDSRIIPSTY